MGFNQYNLGNLVPYQTEPKFQSAKPSDSAEDISISSYVFYGSNPKDPFRTLGPLFKHTMFRTTRQCYIPNFKQSSLEVFKYILPSNTRSLGKDHF